MKICELCKSTARIYCDSDEANLCWNCDFKVHSANFLVAKHSRSLLCHVCQSPTPWNGSGEKLGRTISVCERCVDDYAAREESHGDNDDDESSSSDDDDEEDGENQVVPWSDSSPPPPASSASSEVSSSRFDKGGGDICLKRMRESSLDLCSEDVVDSASSDKNIITPATGCARAAFVDSYSRRPLKCQRTESNPLPPPPPPKVNLGLLASLRSEAIVQTVKRVDRKSGEGRYNDRRNDDCDGDSSVSS